MIVHEDQPHPPWSAHPDPYQFGDLQVPRILLAEDDREMRELLAWILWRAGFAVETCTDGISLLERLEALAEKGRFDPFYLVISDIRMPGVTGMEILEYLQSHPQLPPLLLITAFGDQQTHQEANRCGAAILDKPFDLDAFTRRAWQLVQSSGKYPKL